MAHPINSLPGVKLELQDAQLRIGTTPIQPKITLIGTSNNPNLTPGEPFALKSDDDVVLLDNFFATDGSADPTGPVQRPSELSKAAAEAFAGGADNVEVVVLPDPSNLAIKLLLTPSNTQRYDALTSVYGLLEFSPVDIVLPVSATIDATGLPATQNFGYQLANFCHQTSVNERFAIGVIGVTPPVAGDVVPTLAQNEAWVTALEAFNTATVLGADFRIGNGVTDTNGDSIPDTYAFWATEDEGIPVGTPPRYDADVETDKKGQPVDLGKYISVVTDHVRIINEVSPRVNPTLGYYHGTLAPTYAGMISGIPANIGTTNRVLRGVTPTRAISPGQSERLSNKRYVCGILRSTGYVVTQDNTWAYKISDNIRSDFTLLTTVRITADTVTAIRTRAMRYIGGPNNVETRAGLRADIDEVLALLIKNGYLQSGEHKLNITPAQAVLGKLDVDVKIVPAFEILQIKVNTALAAQ
jgi:hypothetical protein